MRQYDFTTVSAIYGTVNYNDGPTKGYAVRDTFDRRRHLGYVAKVGKVWKAVRPKQFGTFGGFHIERRNLHGEFATRHDAAEYLRRLAANAA